MATLIPSAPALVLIAPKTTTLLKAAKLGIKLDFRAYNKAVLNQLVKGSK